MYCPSCGKELPDDARFCAFCGTVTAQQPAAGHPEAAPVPPTKEINLLAIILPVAALLLAAIVVIVLVFNSPKLVLSRAAAKSVKAYTQAVSGLEITDLSKLAKEKAYNTYTDLTLTDIDPDLFGQLPTGIGLRTESAASMEARDITMSLTPYYGAVDLLTAQVAIQDSLVLAYVPDLLGDTYYAANTTTLGKDLVESGLAYGIESLGFNVFEIAELMQTYTQPTEEATQALTAAAKDLTKSLEVKKGDKAELDINGYTVSCKGYDVTIPLEAMEAFLQALEEYANTINYEQMYREIYLALGMPEDTIGDFFSNADFAAYGTVFRDLEEALGMLGDIRLQVYLSGGYISAIFWEDTIDNIPMAYAFYLGGGDTYVNDLSMEVTVEDSSCLVTSHGNHNGAEDTYSDELVVEVTEYGETFTLFQSALYYYPEKEGTLEWSAIFDTVTIDAAGSLNMEKDGFTLSLDEVSLAQYGEQALAFSFDYSMSEYTPLLDAAEYTLLLPMTPEKSEQLTAQLQENLLSWVTGLLSQIPELMDMLY